LLKSSPHAVAPVTLVAIGGLHVAWGLGATWPHIDRDPADPAACFAVAGLLGVAAGLVAGRPRRAPRLSRLRALALAALSCPRGPHDSLREEQR
jgi:hypothetical protein